jgi:glycolate oxidase FAD binding subunit
MSSNSLESIVGRENVEESCVIPGVPVAHPVEVDQARELFKLASSEGQKLLLLGKGSKLGWSCLANRPDFALSTSRLSGIIEFEPGDGTLTALAGTSMEELNSTTRGAGLTITPDVPRPETASLGGVIATGASGSDRLAMGPGRLHVLGTRVLQPNGEVTRSGGNLVKNVTGYDLMRLYGGSFGCLALVTEASLRLGTVPEGTIVLSMDFDELETALGAAEDVLAARVSPRAVTLENQLHPGQWSLHVVLSGRLAHIEFELDRLAQLLKSPRVSRETAADELKCRLRDLEPDSRERAVLHVGVQPSRLRPTIAALLDGLGPSPRAEFLLQPGIATVDVGLEPGSSPPGPDTLLFLSRTLRASGASTTLRVDRPMGMELAADPDDPLRSSLMERLRATYDPSRLLCTRPPLGGLR